MISCHTQPVSHSVVIFLITTETQLNPGKGRRVKELKDSLPRFCNNTIFVNVIKSHTKLGTIETTDTIAQYNY